MMGMGMGGKRQSGKEWDEIATEAITHMETPAGLT